jgi:hypothetical protein
LQKRDEQKVDLEKKQQFIENERKKTIERLKQYKMVSTYEFREPNSTRRLDN